MKSYTELIDDPQGLLRHDAIDLDEFEDNPTGQFIEHVQDIRYQLHALLTALDDCEGCTATTERLMPGVIAQLGVIVRAEADWADRA